MGLLRDLFTLMRAGVSQSVRMDHVGNIRESARLAQLYGEIDPHQPLGTHGSATANPFANLSAHQNAIPASGTVLGLAPTGADLEGIPVYAVDLRVQVDGWDAYRTTYQTVIAAAALSNWQPGAVLPFRVAPDDPHALMVG